LRDLRSVLKLLGLLLVLFGASLIPILILSLWESDGALVHFAQTLGICLGLAAVLWLPNRRIHVSLSRRDGFLVVVVFWVAVSTIGAVPFMLGSHLGFLDSLFEAVSGVTTTGASVMPKIEGLPPSLLMFRQGLQWLGGMGMVVMALAVMPMLGVGGMRLYVAETPGPLKEEKIVPRIQQTASILLGVYTGLTAACALSFYLAGMNGFDAIAHSLSTLSTGGFSTHDTSIAYYRSLPIELVAVVFMVLGGVSFGVHFVALSRRSPSVYIENAETRWYLAILIIATLVTAAGLVLEDSNAVGWSFRAALFQVSSIMTSTGFGTEPFWLWAGFLPLFLMLVSMIGGCGGSTAGGVKVFRFLLVIKQVLWNMKRLLHPSGEFTVTMGGRAVERSVLDFVWGFVSAYILGYLVMWALMVVGGLDTVSAFGAVAACINNLGPGLGTVGSSFVETGALVKGVGIFAMLFGRMEVFTILILLHPDFWGN